MKCATCGRETKNLNSRFCEVCAKEFQSRVPTPPAPVIKPDLRSMGHLVSTPAPLTSRDSLNHDHQAPPSSYDGKRMQDKLARDPKETPSSHKTFKTVSISIFVVSVIVLAFFFGLYPYTEAHNLITRMTPDLDAAKLSHKTLLEDLLYLSNFDSTPIDSQTRIGIAPKESLIQIAQTISQSPADSIDSWVHTIQSVAGANTIAYDPYLEELSTITRKIQKDVIVARGDHDILEAHQVSGSNMWIVQKIKQYMAPLVQSSGDFVTEADNVIGLYAFTITLEKRIADINAALEQSFDLGNLATIEHTLSDINTELVDLSQDYSKISTPLHSEELTTGISSWLKTSKEFFTEFEHGVHNNDIDRIVSAANVYYVELARFASQSSDDELIFWEMIAVPDLYAAWEDETQTFEDFLSDQQNKIVYKVSSLFDRSD
ncbi:hypothetical protein COY32_03000 [candidate division WWE3 bacterium CG_4_10_14_0_2_um_filter_41_14]|uniref:Uncharacterized protein n=1 Tax=candidate division WWE3 bacterium CG_4_10_14_0_2_um_filter_41_14 TaxID=1975072 RepID=A0A2M7TJD8_UNCKA|nr:MAG: hypothetical protein COY32_03000 [candidate division WWE3 bacterium CG_4_10_14_0_2_um_filter_41_14]